MPTVTVRISDLSEASPAALEELAKAQAETGVPMKVSSTTANPIVVAYDLTLVIDPA